MSLPLTSSQASCPAEDFVQRIHHTQCFRPLTCSKFTFPSIISFILFPQRGMWVSEVKIHLSPDVSDLPAFIPLAVSLSPHTTKHSLAFPLFESGALTYTREKETPADMTVSETIDTENVHLKRSPLFSFPYISFPALSCLFLSHYLFSFSHPFVLSIHTAY